MKNIVIIVSLIFTFQFANSQGTLQFNTVINKHLFSTGSNTNSSGTVKEFSSFTIPDGKIWKVNFVATYSSNSNIPFGVFTQGPILLRDTGGTNFVVWNRDGTDDNTIKETYLNSGSYQVFGSYWTTTNQVGLQINGIEYNIISN